MCIPPMISNGSPIYIYIYILKQITRHLLGDIMYLVMLTIKIALDS